MLDNALCFVLLNSHNKNYITQGSEIPKITQKNKHNDSKTVTKETTILHLFQVQINKNPYPDTTFCHKQPICWLSCVFFINVRFS